MDANIRRLIVKAQSSEGEENPALLQAHTLLQNVARSRASTDIPESFGQDLYVLCAEVAYQHGFNNIAKDCIQMFFMKQPASNQFLGRAYLCQAQLLAPKDATDNEQFEKSVTYILKTISFAKANSRYHFLVYNASVIYWQLCRPFLKSGCRQYLVQSLQQIVKALDEIEDKDSEWRAQLMIALVECNIDAHKRSEASQVASTAAAFIKTNVPSLYKKIFGLMTRYQLGDVSKNQKELKSSPELALFHRICKLKSSLNLTSVINEDQLVSQPNSVMMFLEESEKDLSIVNLEQGDSTINYAAEIESILNLLGSSDSALQVAAIDGKTSAETLKEDDVEKKDRKFPKSATKAPALPKKVPQTPSDKRLSKRERCNLLIELARLCLELNFPDHANVCVEQLKTLSLQDPSVCLEQEFIECELMVKILGKKQESFKKSVIDIRVQAIKRCEEAIMNAIRIGDPNVIQAGCVTQWNLCLPLLQPNLRNKVRRPLTLVAQALEQIDSLLVQLRCQVHTELSHCEEDQEQIQTATENLKKALLLDDTGVYHDKLVSTLKRLELRAQLYKQPEGTEDLAAMIIEQARTADSGTKSMKRSMLVKAGEALAPDSFLLVLDSENDTKVVSTGKEALTKVKQLSGKAKQYKSCIVKTEGHLNRTGDSNIMERIKLWVDLVKIARKQEVWDVCRTACKFCLLYDDDKVLMTIQALDNSNANKSDSSQSDLLREESSIELEKKTSSVVSTQVATPQTQITPIMREFIRMFAEVSFIQGEALIQLLRSHNVELNQKPLYPEDKSKKPKGYVAKKPEEDLDWVEYSDWLMDLSKEATQSFLRGLSLGVSINEPWIVCSAAAYIWNYNNHIISQGEEDQISSDLNIVLEGLKKVGHAGETVMLVNICNALANGYMKNWIPKRVEPEKLEIKAELEIPIQSAKGKSAKGVQIATKVSKTASLATVSPEALVDLKKAIEVCDLAMKITNGSEPEDVVPIYSRLPILQTWVKAKQLAQQQISKNLGVEDDNKKGGQNSMTRAIVAVEILSVNKNGQMEFKDNPSLEETFHMVSEAKWSDKFVELQLWARLTALAYADHIHNQVLTCSKKTLSFENNPLKLDRNQEKVKQEMLFYSCLLMGQSLVENMKGRNTIRREALEAFVNSAKFAKNASNYDLVMMAARHFWNTCLPLVGQPIERELLKEPLKTILNAIAAVADKNVKDASLAEEQERDETDGRKSSIKESTKIDNDLSLRAAMYGVLFQSFADKGEWDQALQSIDNAVSCMPRTKHRLILFKHRVMVKAKLGQAIDMDMQKFKDEPEDFVANMWHRVALSSKLASEQMKSYQKAIDILENPSNVYQKVEYIIEFGQWLYCNHFPIKVVQDLLEWAVDLLLSIKPPEIVKANSEVKRTKDKPSSTSVLPANTPKQKDVSSKNVSSILQPKSPVSMVNRDESKLDQSDSLRTSDLGRTPSPSLSPITQLKDIRQLETLYRIHIVLAEMLGLDSVHYKDTLLTAYNILMRLWEALIRYFGQPMKDISKNVLKEDAPATSSGPKGKKDEKKKDDKEKVQLPKRKRKFPLDVLPSDIESWAIYDWPEEGVVAFKVDTYKSMSLNEVNFPKPMLTYHYTDSLIRQLIKVGYSQFTLPLLAFEDLLSRSVLSSQALNKLVHLKSLIICQELNLKTGINFHQKILGNLHIAETDQAVSRNEIAKWQELQLQVAKEEQRVREISALEQSISSKIAISSAYSAHANIRQDDSELGAPHLGKVYGAVSVRDVWTDTAELLIKQVQYQRAREYLTEANIAAEAFNDKPLQARILFLFAKLAYHEAQYGQTVALCTKSQELGEAEDIFWYKSIKLLANAVVMMKADKENINKAKRLLIEAINEFTAHGDSNPNRYKITRYYCAKLEVKLLQLYIDNLLLKLKVDKSDQTLELIYAGCERYESITNQLIHLGHWLDARKLILKHALLFKHLAMETTDANISKIYYMEAMNVLKQAVNLSEKVFHDVHSLVSLAQMKNLSTAVQRELAEVNIEMAELLTHILAIRHTELRQEQMQQEKKTSIILQIEEFVCETPVYEGHDKEWLDVCSVAGNEAMSYLLSAQSLCSTVIRMKAKCLVTLGKLLHTLAECESPEPPAQWTVQDIEIMKMQLAAEEAEAAAAVADIDVEAEESEDDSSILPSENQVSKLQQELFDVEEKKRASKYRAQIIQKQLEQDKSLHLFMCASEYLYQGLNICLQNQILDVASIASYELVKLLAQFDSHASSLMLALHQSCQTSLKLEKLLISSLPDPSTSKLAAILHQKNHLLMKDVTTNNSVSPIYRELKLSLNADWQAGKKLEVSTNHQDLLKEFPSNYNLIILQHSPDKKFLYGSILDKPKGSVMGVSKAKDKTDKIKDNLSTIRETPLTEDFSRARIFSTPVNYNSLLILVEKVKAYKQQQQTVLLRREFHCVQVAQREKMMENVEASQKIQIKVAENYDEEEAELESLFTNIVNEMNYYLQPVLEPICHSLRYPNSSVGMNIAGQDVTSKISKETATPQNECLVLLADIDLMELPLEACVHLQIVEGVISVSRDFSLQLLRKRVPEEKKDEKEEKDAKKKTSKDAVNVNSRIPGARDAKQKQTKVVPLNRLVQPWQTEVNTNNFKYIVDPYLECSDGERKKPIEVINSLLTTYESQFTSRWLGVTGSIHTPSLGEWEIYISESSAFIFYGFERFLSYIPPSKLATLNIPDCSILFSFDLSETAKSFQRQSKLDLHKLPSLLSLEAPVEMAMLSSLSGVKCIIGNQWHASLSENAIKLEETMEYLLKKGYCTGQALHMIQNPIKAYTLSKLESMAAKSGQKSAESKADSKANKGQAAEPTLMQRPSLPESGEIENYPVVTRAAFNTVCYGMPNLIVTQ
ncbi:cilia- and flagella-associated protein 46-like isoform X3 [Biomphalaria glabrata]|uniref:Cilia- and flagella-associated protein 46-like isoform X3 n=1 Tax=Biomphalaria glabrata TaxID=6526 RepID=A0A9W3BLU1_BIOGL|nr:cilia- and flagella-associated protein 46-like isoform X3 [Biomphalaria glabrata]